MKISVQFDATPDGNCLHTLDGSINYIWRVPDGASEDFGYLTAKQQILYALLLYGSPAIYSLSFWYDGQEEHLAPDAAAAVDYVSKYIDFDTLKEIVYASQD